MSIAELTCPHCGAPVDLRATFCAYCRAPLDVRKLLEIDASTDRRILDFTTGVTPPGTIPGTFTPIRGAGAMVRVSAGTSTIVFAGQPCRNASAALTGIVHDPDGGLVVGVRIARLGAARAGYLLRVRPALGEWSLLRFIGAPGLPALRDTLAEDRGVASFTGVGQALRIELRAADTLLQVRVNDRLVGKAEDPYFGFGEQQWGALSAGGDASVTLVAFEHGRL